MKRILSWFWTWSWLPASASVLLFAVWFTEVSAHFVTFGCKVDSAPFVIKFTDLGRDHVDHGLRKAKIAISGQSLGSIDPDLRLRTLSLRVPAQALKALDADLPYSGRTNVQAQLTINTKDGQPSGEESLQVKLRYRGDTYAHWGSPKKSFRIKTKKSRLFLGMRKFNLIAPKYPEQLNNWLSYKVARQLGVLAPRVELVNLSLNGEFHGLYQLTEQVDESTLRRANRAPGDIYAGELLLRDSWVGVPNRLFARASLWDKVAANNRYPKNHYAPLEALIKTINQPADEATMQRLADLVDIDKFARFSALELLTQSHHNDHFHNWKLYWDPWRHRFEPIVWDPVGWISEVRPPDEEPLDAFGTYSPLHELLHMNAEFLVARQQVLDEFFASNGEEKVLMELERAFARVAAVIPIDPNLRPLDTRLVTHKMRAFESFVRRTLHDVRELSKHDGSAARWRPPTTANTPLLISVAGSRPLESLEVQFAQRVSVGRIELRTRRLHSTESTNLAGHFMQQGDRLTILVPLVAELERVFGWTEGESTIRNTQRQPRVTTYEFVLSGIDMTSIVAVSSGGQSLVRDSDLVSSVTRDLYQIAPSPALKPQIWTGDVYVDGIMELTREVQIAAGTTIHLAPRASIVFKNRVIARGSAANPIRFACAEPDQLPWGTVALDGKGCSGSRLDFCEFDGGSGLRTAVAEYTGMLAIHDAEDVEVSQCKFTGCGATEDVIHAAYATVVFNAVIVVGGGQDGIDCDLSRVFMLDCRISDCGDDAIDFMQSRALVSDCVFTQHRDKGMSVGERSQVIATGSRFDHCGTAVEVKDDSLVHLLHCTLRDCTTALLCRAKNWRYAAGGDLRVFRCQLDQNHLDASSDRFSSLLISDSTISEDLPSHIKQVACDDKAEARQPGVVFPTQRREVHHSARSVWARAIRPRRGASVR